MTGLDGTHSLEGRGLCEDIRTDFDDVDTAQSRDLSRHTPESDTSLPSCLIRGWMIRQNVVLTTFLI